MQYIMIEFTFGYIGVGFQVIDDNGVVVDYVDTDGAHIDLPDVWESKVLDPSPDRPAWASPAQPSDWNSSGK